MKKRILSLALALCLLASAFVFAPSASASTVYFSAVNDTLLELSSSSMPTFINGALYVPYTMLNNNILGVYFSYDKTEQKASLLYGSQQIYFDLSSGETFDTEGSYYSATAAFYNSKIYLPLSFICGFFGFACSTISSDGLGTIVRIKDGNVILSDTLFEQAARNLMTERLNKYLGTDTPTPSTPATPAPSETPEEPETFEDVSVYLAFRGADGAADVLDALARYGMHGAFFLTADEISADPDLVRRMVCAGHAVGISLGEAPESEYENASRLLFAAAKRRTMLVTGAEAPAGTVLCGFDSQGENSVSAAQSTISKVSRSFSVLFDTGEVSGSISSLLSFLSAGKYTVQTMNELNGGQ